MTVATVHQENLEKVCFTYQSNVAESEGKYTTLDLDMVSVLTLPLCDVGQQPRDKMSKRWLNIPSLAGT